MNKILKKIAALATTAALFVSVYVPILAQAATVNSMKTIGTLSKSNPYGYELDIQQIDISGDMAFCIEPNDDMHRNDTYTQNQADSYWQTTLGQNQRDEVGLILYYGYYNGDTSHQSQAYFAATQILLWEVTGFHRPYKTVNPLRTFDLAAQTTSCSNSLLNYYSASSGGPTKEAVTTAYNSIVNKVKSHNKLMPNTYATAVESKKVANVNELKYNITTGRYEKTFTMQTAQWNEWGMTKAITEQGFRVTANSIDGTYTRYTVSSTTYFLNPQTVMGAKTLPAAHGGYNSVLVYANTTNPGGQTAVIGAEAPAATAYISFQTTRAAGDFTIEKIITSDDGTTTSFSDFLKKHPEAQNAIGFYLAYLGTNGGPVQLTGNNGAYSYSAVQAPPTIMHLDGSGKIKVSNLPYGEYKLYEVYQGGVSAEDLGLKPASTAGISLTIDAATEKITVENTEMSGDLEITKTDDHGKVLSGIRFNVEGTSDSGRKVSLSGVTDAAGKLSFDNIPVGTYKVTEDKKSVPAGYFTSEEKTITITADNTTKLDVINNPKKGSIKVHKTAEDDIIEGIEIRLSWTENGEAKSYSKLTGADGWVTFDELLVYNTGTEIKIEYTVEEINTDIRYVIPEKVTITLPDNGDSRDISATAELHNELKKFTLEVVKTEPGTGVAVPGAVYGLYKDDVLLDEYTTDEDGRFVTDPYECGEGYYFKELVSPAGYAIDDKIHYIGADAKNFMLALTPIVMSVNDRPIMLAISKKDVYGEELEGASMQLIDAEGNVVEEWISNGTPHVVSNLSAGDYVIKEAAAPDGYVIATEITFSIDEHNKVTINNIEATAKDEQGNPTLTLIDDTTKVEISKQSITGDGELPGAKLQVIDENGNVVDEWTSTDEPHYIEGKLIAVKTYTLHEEIAPEGYHIANDITFTVNADGTVTKVVMIDDIMKGSIQVQKKTEGQLNVEGIDIILSGTSNIGIEVNMTATTDAAGKAVFESVPIGTYTLTEDGATVPVGYLVADPVEGVEVIYAEQTDVEIFNAEATGSIQIQKKTEGQLNVAGIDIILSGESTTGREIELIATTDANGLAVFDNVPVGIYKITEDGATVPAGYLVANPVEGVEVIYAEQTDVEIFNDEMTGSIRVQKKTEGQLNVANIDFILSGESTTGRAIEITATTDANGLAVFDNVPVGIYKITEDGATVPAGYLTADPVEGVEVIYSEQTDITITNEKIPDNPVTGEETPFVCTMCILSILAVAVIGRRSKRLEDR